ncbi:MAG: DUF1059 domain-containing protein [Gemmatimonadota bacterium]
MAKRISCADVGLECDFTVTADTEDELLQVVAEHARDVHGIEEITPELLEQVKAAIHDE